MSSPDIEVIDKAISSIRDEQEVYTCHALKDACCVVNSENNTSYYDITYHNPVEYQEQFKEFCWIGDVSPVWWGRNFTQENKEARLCALERFKQACIYAGKKE